MNANTLLLYIGLPAVFLLVASVMPGKMPVKGICIALAYLCLIFLDGWMCINMTSGQQGAVVGKHGSPFGLAFLIVSLWAFILIGLGDAKSGKEDNRR